MIREAAESLRFALLTLRKAPLIKEPKRTSMKKTFIIAAIFSLTFSTFAEEAKKPTEVNEKCPISGKDVNPKCTAEYEEKTYAFCCGKCNKKWTEARKASLYDQIGGQAAINAAVDLFYTKVLVDDRVAYLFENVNMKKQHKKQKAFLAAAFGGPTPWDGKDMRKAHANMDLTEEHFNAIAENLLATLQELKLKKEHVDQIMTIVGSTKKDVLNQ